MRNRHHGQVWLKTLDSKGSGYVSVVLDGEALYTGAMFMVADDGPVGRMTVYDLFRHQRVNLVRRGGLGRDGWTLEGEDGPRMSVLPAREVPK